MPIKEINIENIKTFVKPQNLKFAPLTFKICKEISFKSS